MKFVTRLTDPKEWGGLTDKNHLGAAYEMKPQLASTILAAYHAEKTDSFSLVDFLGQYDKKYLDDDTAFEWYLKGSIGRRIPLKAAYTDAGSTAVAATDKVGINHGQFWLEFDEDYFHETELIFGENKNYQIRILAPAELHGSGYLYRCQLFSGDEDDFIPYQYLAAGKEFTQLYAPVEHTLSQKGAELRHIAPFKMRNFFTYMRMESTVPGTMLSKPIALELVDEKTGKKFTMWMDQHDLDFEMQYREAKDLALYYGKMTRNDRGEFPLKGKSGFPIETGAGLRQQIESGNMAYYPTGELDIRYVHKLLLDLSVNKTPTDRREFVIRTGEYGMTDFHYALQQEASLYTPLRDTLRLSMNGNSLTYKGQFKRYEGPQGIVITVQHDPMKDDRRTNILSYDGAPAESRTFDILDVGTAGDVPNIQLVYQKGNEDILRYKPGLRDPFRPNGQNMITASGVDGYTIYRMAICGVKVHDPSRCLILKPNILAGIS